MHSNHWINKRNSEFPSTVFKLTRRSRRSGHLLYSVSHSMECAKDGAVDVHLTGRDVGLKNRDMPLEENVLLSPHEVVPEVRNTCTSSRPPQTCALARDFPQDLLLVIFNYTLWFQLRDAGPQDYVAHQVASSLESYTKTHPPILLSKKHSPLFLSFVCSHWRFVCLGTPTLWSNLHIHVWNQPFVAYNARPPTKSCSADRARVSLCRLFLERSGSAPLVLSINGDVSDTATVWLDMQVVRATDERMVLGRLFQICAEHRERWAEVRVKNLDDRFLFGLLFDPGPELKGEIKGGKREFKALEKLSIGLKHVEEDGALFPRGDPNSSCRSWLEIRLRTLVGFVEGLPDRCPGLRQLEVKVDLIDVRLVAELIGSCRSLFANTPGAKQSGCSDETIRQRMVEACQAFDIWHKNFVKGLPVGGEEPLYTGSLRKAWARFVKDEDAVGLKDVDAGVDSLDWSSPLAIL